MLAWRLISFTTCALNETSSAETASSATISFGASARDADALELPAEELLRKARRNVGGEADHA